MSDTKGPADAGERSDTYGLHHRFLRGLKRSPDGPAIRFPETEVTYRTVHELALRWAGALLAGGRGPKTVGILAEKTVTGYVGALAALYAGAAAVPLNPGFPTARTSRMLELAEVSALIVDEAGEAALSEILPSVAGVHVLAPHRLGDNEAPALDRPRPARVEDVAYVLFTSGSTGSPKGIPINHGNLFHYFSHMERRYDVGPQDVFSSALDLNWDPTLLDVYLAWGVGAAVAPIPSKTYRYLPEFITEQGITVWNSPPSTVALLRRTGSLAPGCMPTLRLTFFGGEALRFEDILDWQEAAPRSAVVNLYGPTELTITIADHLWEAESSQRYGHKGVAPIGHIYEGHEHLLLQDDGSISHDEGELCVTGPQMAVGYLDPAHERGRFLEHDDHRWYRTGDRVRRADNGELVYLSRVDSQVKVQGVRVELTEIDHAMRSRPDIRDALTVTATKPNGVTEIVVFYSGTRTSPIDLAQGLRGVLPPAMLPRHFEHLDELPCNSNQKIDRPTLAARAADLLHRADTR